MKSLTAQIKNSRGFTLIELIVVIAILGVLATVLITTINPLDKVNSANDSGVVSSISQIGRTLDNYAANKNNSFPLSGTLNATLGTLNTAGESKISTYSPPSGYTVTYMSGPSGTCTTAAQDCTGYAILVQGLKSLKYASTPNFQVVNGKTCYVTNANVITQANLNLAPTAPTLGCP